MSTSLLEELKLDTWNPVLTAAAQAVATDALEAGRILYLPRLGFALLPHEQRFLSAEWSDGETKNINLRGGERRLRGARGGSEDLDLMQAMMERFSSRCATLIGALLPHYVPHLTLASTSFRPCEYDHLLLQLHDRVKADASYQQQAPQERIDFPVGSTWIVFSDQVLHAAMSGQFVMEETLMLPVSGMRAPETSPLRVLERITGQRLA